MKTTLLVSAAIASMLAAGNSWAGLARSAVSAVGLEIHGIYVSSDASCQTGLVPALPLSASARSYNFTQNPVLGTGALPSIVNCVLLIAKNNVSLSWNSGSYATTSSGGSDSVCNGGGTVSVSPCVSRSVSWPSAVSLAMNVLGLPTVSSCGASPTGSEIVPIYLSTNSACSGNATLDNLIGQSGCSPNAFSAPSSANSTNGVLMGSSTANAAFAFVADPSEMIGNVSGSCGAVSRLPRFGSRTATSVSAVTPASSTAPAISTVAVNSGIGAGSVNGGETLTVNGTGFAKSSAVMVGGRSCSNVSVNAAGTQLTCTLSSGTAGTTNVAVVDPASGQAGTLSNGFEYRATPTITSISPTNLPNNAVNAQITIVATGIRSLTTFGTPVTTSPFSTPYYRVTIGRGTSSQVNCASPYIAASTASSQSITCLVSGPGAAASGLTVHITNFPDTTNEASRSGHVSTGFNFN